MEQVFFGLGLDTSRADAALRRTAALGDDLFRRRGFKLNVTTTGLPLGRITGDVDNFSRSLDAAAARVGAFTATTGLVYGLANAFRSLFTESIKLEQQLASLQSILKANNSELSRLSNDLLKSANATGQSFDVAVEAATEFSRQGLTLNKTLEATNAALALARISGMDAAAAVQSLTGAMNTFNNEGLTYQSILDTIISLDNSFAASAAGIAEGLKRIGGVASEAGIELKEIASLITVVQQVSARGEAVISNGLKTIITRLQRGKVQEILNEIGIATQTSNGEFRNYIDILTDLANKQDQLSDAQRAYVNESVAGVFQINTLQASLKALGGEYSLFDKAVQVAGSSAGDTAARLRVLNDTTATSLQVLRNNLSRTFADIGERTVLPIARSFIEASNGILEFFQASNFESKLGDIDTRGIGQKFAEGIIEGIGSFFNSSGKVLLLAIVGRLFGRIITDFAGQLGSLAGINKSVVINKDLQLSVNKAIAAGNQALVQRLATTDSLIVKNQILNQLLQQQSSIANLQLTEALVSRGLKKNNIRTNAKGFIPALLKEQKDIQAGVGGASKKAIPLIRDVNLGRGREKVVVNSDEVLVEDYLKSGKDAIFNQDMIKRAGGLDALKSLGKVRNFAKGSKELLDEYKKSRDKFISAGGSAISFRNTDRGSRLWRKILEAFNRENSQKSTINPLSGGPISSSGSARLPVDNPLGSGIRSGPAPRSAGNPLGSGRAIIRSNVPNPLVSGFKEKRFDTDFLQKRRLLAEAQFAKEREAIAKRQLKAIEKQEQALKKEKILERRQKIGLGIGIAAPFAAGAIRSSIGDNSEAGRRAVSGIESVATGLTVASLGGFNPLAISAGIVVTAFSFLKKEADASVKTFEDLKKSADSIIAANQDQINSVQNTIAAQNQLNDLIKANSSIEERIRARQAVISSSSQIKDDNVRRLLLSGDTSPAAQAQIFKFQQGLQQSSRAQEGFLIARKAVEEISKDRGFLNSGLFRDTTSNRKSLNVENFEGFIKPIIDSIDLATLSSSKAVGAIKSLSDGSIDAAYFLQILKDNLSLSSEVADGASKEFQNLADVISVDSRQALEKYLLAQLRYKGVLDETARSLSKAEQSTIQFKKAFDISINNLIKRFNFDLFDSSARTQSAIEINRNILQSQRDLGQISELDFARQSSNLDTQEVATQFANKNAEAINNALKPIVEELAGVVSPENQAGIIESISNFFGGKATLADVTNEIKTLVKNENESENLLKSIKDSNRSLGEESARLRVEQELANDKITSLLQLQLNRLTSGPKLQDVLTGETSKARSELLSATEDRSFTERIKKINDALKVGGLTDKRKNELLGKRDALVAQQQLRRDQDLEARKFLLPGTNPALSSDAEKQKQELLAADFYKTQAQLLKQGLDEINALSIEKTGSAKFSSKTIGGLVSALERGELTGKAFLEESKAGTSNPAIRDILSRLIGSSFSDFAPLEKFALEKVIPPKAVDLSKEADSFLGRLDSEISPDDFRRASSTIKKIEDIRSRIKNAIDNIAAGESELSNFDVLAERNRQILTDPEVRGRLRPDAIGLLRRGLFTEAEARTLPDFQQNLIKESGLGLVKEDRFSVENRLKQERDRLEGLKRDQEKIDQEGLEELKKINSNFEKLFESNKPATTAEGGAKVAVEQTINAAIDVRGVDQQMLADIKSAVTSAVEGRIKEIIKDTFNVVPVTKPTTAVA